MTALVTAFLIPDEPERDTSAAVRVWNVCEVLPQLEHQISAVRAMPNLR